MLDWKLLSGAEHLAVSLGPIMRSKGLRRKPLIVRKLSMCLAIILSTATVVPTAIAASLPGRILKEYALTSAYARENYPDPKNWRLLGSNDGGQTWALLDVQTNQT